MARRGGRTKRELMAIDGMTKTEMVRVYRAWKLAGTDKGYKTLAKVFGVTYHQARNLIAYRGWGL